MKKSKYIDHTLLKANSTKEQIIQLCDEAIEYDFASVCVNPGWVKMCAEKLAGTGVMVCTVVGFPLGAKQGVYSSDSTPFADAGIPAVSFARWAAPGTGAIHSRVDVIEHISERILGEDTEYICKVVEDLANAYMIPVKKEIPQNMKDEIFKYYGKDLLKKEDK